LLPQLPASKECVGVSKTGTKDQMADNAMKITIQGQDYSASLDASLPLTIERTLNAPSLCRLWLSLPAGGTLAAPARYAQLAVIGDDGQVYFTGYIAAPPMPEYAGMSMTGPSYRYALEAVSDEILLDLALMAPSKVVSGLTAGALITALVTHTGTQTLATSALTLNAAVSNFAPEPGAPFSKSAGQVAAQVRAAYRALSGALALTTIPAAVHPLSETSGTLTLANLSLTAGVKRALANDITVCGENEPAAYVTEYFLGDGVTTQFVLSQDPFFLPSSKTTLINELFNEPAIDTGVWGNPSGSTYFSLGAGGLAMNGGSGIDGQTQLAWIDPIEMGGTLLLEADGLSLANASTGILAAFYCGGQSAASCIAGFQATAQQGTGAVSLQPLVYGAACGTSYLTNPSNQYTLRIRAHCPELQRELALYLASGDDGALTAGGQTSPAPAKLLFEIQPCVDGVMGMPVVLYDGAVVNLPSACTVVAASSLNFHGAMRSLVLSSLGSAWVVSTPPNSGPFTRRIGTAAQSAECHVERTGKLAFYTGIVPVSGEQIAVSYRAIHRAVGRAVNSASQQTLAAQGSPAEAVWIGTVTEPPARSSADCRNAATVMTKAAASTSALWSGTYRGTNFDFAASVWPGDALALTAPSCNLDAQMVVRTAKLSYTASTPDVINYEIAFANDWADDLAIKTSATVPADTWLPAMAGYTPLTNLNALTMTMSGNNVTVNTGVTAPTGGGFEIRTRDYAFMPGEDPTLAMRGSQPNLTFTRIAAGDRYYIRMYDGATPPNYSEFSAELVINIPLSS
jgi:hypothetical protein